MTKSVACALGLLVSSACWLSADDTAVTTPAEVVETPPTVVGQFMLVDNDKIVEGTIERIAGGYRHKRNGGSIDYRESRVLMVADSVDELYEYKVRQIPPHDLAEHYKISKWCLQNGMRKNAEKQLERILSYDPSNVAVQRFLSNLRRHAPERKPREASEPTDRTIAADPSTIVQTFIAGHGQDRFDQYIKLERILINRCSDGACHGSFRHSGSFRLYRRKEGQPLDQKLTARNLQNVLDAINLREPNRSAILYSSVNPHGPLEIPVFGGVNDPMYRELRTFVEEVAKSWAADTTVAGGPPMAMPRRSTMRFGSREGAAASSLAGAVVRRPQKPVPLQPGDDVSRPGFTAAADDDAPRTTPVFSSARPAPPRTQEGADANDPFDPSSFNQSVQRKPSPAPKQ